MKLCCLILFASVTIHAAPVEDDMVVTAADELDEAYSRETRSSDPATRSGIPWHLDRIDQREPKLDGEYNAFAEGC